MKEPAVIVIGILLIFLAIRLFLKPLRFVLRLSINSLAGMGVLIGCNLMSNMIGVTVGINLFSMLLTGLLGLPGAALLLLLGKFL